jgi:asparagine synthase (glutamine-hydrolysing)
VGEAFLAWVSMLPEEWREQFLSEPSQWARDDYRRIWRESEGADLLDRLLVLTIRTYLLDDLLPKADRMAMAHGLETRSPFLDHHLVEFALCLPRSSRIQRMSTKRVLKHAVRDLLPPDILDRRKRGFAVPLERWFRTDLRSFLEATVGAREARLRSHLNGESLDRMLDEHRTGKANHRDAIWALLTLELFLRREGW